MDNYYETETETHDDDNGIWSYWQGWGTHMGYQIFFSPSHKAFVLVG